jgi:hypothetical protein
VWLWVTVPLATGQRTLFFRDVLANHYALKVFGSAALARGEVPAFNPTLGLGQPFRGNPSALAFYPDNVLYLLLPFWSAFNLHFALHWLLALVAMALLSRRLGLGPAAALLAGLTYAGSGWMLSALSFYNIVTVAAWWPLAMAGAVAGGLRGIALGGTACGLALLGGEPVTAALGLVPMVVAAVRRHGWLRGLLTVAGIGAVGLVVAAPQVVATARILGFTFRGMMGEAYQAGQFALPPLRLVEVVVPLPFGWPLDIGPQGWWLGRTAPNLGYYLSLYTGIVATWLALRAARRHRAWASLAVLSLAGAVLLAVEPDLLRAATGGLFRFPEKLLVWYALAVPILAGHGFQEALDREPSRARVALACGALLAVGGVALAYLLPRAVMRSPIPELVAVQGLHLSVYLALGGVLLLVARAALRRRRAGLVIACQLVAVLQLFPLVRTAPTEPLSSPAPWNERLGTAGIGRGAAVFNSQIPRPPWEPPPRHWVQRGTRAGNHLRNALDLYEAPGVSHGLTYPLAPNIEGLASPLYTFVTVEAEKVAWPQRLRWWRVLGVDAVVLYPGPDLPGMRPLDAQNRQGAVSRLIAVEDPAPLAWWPQRVEGAPGARAAFERVSSLDDPVAVVVAAEAVDHDPGGSVQIVSEQPDRIELRVASRGGGLAVVRRSFHNLYRARRVGSGGPEGSEALALLPAQVTLTGVVVPPGEHRVVIEVDDTPEILGGLLSAAALLAVLVIAWRTRGRDRGSTGVGPA